MENNFKQESSQIENLLSKATTAIEVVKNSCYYQDNYAEGEILEDAANYLYNIQDILFEQEYKI
ncbi:hypothetical protein J6N69_04750 [bacterium]|nr:hypothetical protein [bacterium]